MRRRAKKLNRAFNTAIAHFFSQGQRACSGGSCDSGTCTFGATSITFSPEEDIVQVGSDAQVSIHGGGNCFCT